MIAKRWYVIVATILFAALAASGARFLSFSNDYRVFFSSENPQLAAFEALQRVYTKADNILIVVKPKSADIFTARNLDAIRRITSAAWRIPYATRVDSITNYQHSFAEEDDLTVIDLVPKRGPISLADTVRARNVALSDPIILYRIISKDGKTTAVNVTLIVVDRLTGETLMSFEAERRLSDNLKFEFEARLTLVTPANAFTQGIRNDDHFTLRLVRFF